MKKVFFYATMLVAMFLASCEVPEGSDLLDRVEDLESRVEALEKLCAENNTNISSLKTLVDVINSKEMIEAVIPIASGDKILGYTITFSKRDAIIIYSAMDANGTLPVVGVKAESGVYYWTLNGEWLLDDGGKKIAVSGKDGITPQLKIENGFWWVSYDGKATWEKLGEATGGNSGGSNSAGGECMIKEITDEGSSVRFTLADDTVITIAKDPNAPDTNAVFSITYKANGGEGEDVVNKVPYGRIYNIGYTGYWGVEGDKVEFTKEGYDLVSWNTKPDGTGETFLSDYNVAIVALKDMTLYAQWEKAPNRYTLTILIEGVSEYDISIHISDYFDHISDDRYIVNEGEVTLEANCHNANYEFLSWSDGNTDNPRTITITSDTTLTAIFSGGSGEGGDEDEELEVPPTCTDYVDLGLPSGLKWATCNVGASSPEEYGCYFAWGEVTTKRSFTHYNYKWSVFESVDIGWGETEMQWSGYSKYITDEEYNIIDNKNLEAEDDAATVNMGSPWRTPAPEEWEELIDECTWTASTRNGVRGYNVEGPNGNSIFLPAAGHDHSVREFGCYLSNELRNAYEGSHFDGFVLIENKYNEEFFKYTYFDSNKIYLDNDPYEDQRFRSTGLSVRGVRE